MAPSVVVTVSEDGKSFTVQGDPSVPQRWVFIRDLDDNALPLLELHRPE